MTSQHLRNQITVTHWILDELGATVFYTRSDKPGKEYSWHCQPIELMGALDACGSIDEYTMSPHTITKNGNTYTFQMFAKHHKLSQWEAFQIAFRHELEFETSKETCMLELDEILKALQ